MKNNRKLAALILAAAMTVTTPYTAWGCRCLFCRGILWGWHREYSRNPDFHAGLWTGGKRI